MNEEKPDGFRESTEKLWHATRKTLQSATFRASQYRKVVQRKIDLASLHRKISLAHGDIGKLVDDFREAGTADILDREEIQTLFRRLDGYKMEAAEI
ncbi:MAG: hypothetical protein IH614_08815, partial [Desulfuromonadales bacterium]|nr:hypothetical protein [Desulfuromonadales bacterium]